jgi:glycosyltransferase involved in cell wall biosynthesis
MRMSQQTARPFYRLGFILNTTLGNKTRYLNFRKYAERDASVHFEWAPVSHYDADPGSRPWRFLPAGLSMRLFVLQQTLPVMRRLDQLDAVMVHLFEADVILPVRRLFKKSPVLFSSTDEAPIVDRATYPLYPDEVKKPVWRQKLRLAVDRWRVRNTDHFVPFSRWGGDILEKGCGAPAGRVHPIHVGIDLEIWPRLARAERQGGRVKILFVGGDFVRKGGDLLLEAFSTRFSSVAELHLVSRQAPQVLPPHVYAHRDLNPNDGRLRELYATCDFFVLPSTADLIAWGYIEALSCGLPVIGTDTGATRELVRSGETGFLIPVGDAGALAEAMQALIDDPALRQRMGHNGRELIEQHYSAAINVPRILKVMKDAVDQHRQKPRS